MQVQAVHGAAPHDVHPAIGHGERASGEIQLQPARERRDVPIQLAGQRGKRRRLPMHAVGRVVRGVAAGIILRGPAPAAGVVQA